MKDTHEQIVDRLRSIRDNPPEVIPEPRIVRRETPIERPTATRCPTCGRTNG